MPFFDEPSIPLSDKDAASGVAALDNMSRLDPYYTPGVVSPLSYRDEWRHWRKACANTASQRVKINVVTDSTHAWTATNYQGSWVWQMFSDLCKVNGQVAEHGFVPLCATTSGAYTGRVWSGLGSATNRSDSGWGYTSSTVPYGTTPSMTSYTSYCDRIQVWYSTYVSLVGSFQVKIDGSTVATITQSTGTTLGGRVWDSGALSAASHTVQIVPQNASFPSTIEGASFFAGNYSSGFALINGGHFGQKSDVFAAASASGQWHMDGVDNSAPDIVIICLTINDRTAGTSPTTVKTNIITQITQWITKCTAAGAATPTFLIVGDYDTGATESDPDTYEVAMREAAAATGSVFISRGAMMGYVGAAGDPESLTVDNKHPGPVGHKLIGRAMARILLEGAGWSSTAPSDTAVHIPSLRTLGTSSTQAAAGDHTHSGVYVSTGSTPAPPVNIQTFTSSGTWTKPTAPTGCAAYTTVEVFLLGAGGGGGSGRRGAAGSVRCGGGGGGGGAWTRHLIDASSLGATETVYVGAAGTGGAAQTSDNTDGISGTGGGNSIFGAARRALATGGGAGSGGTASSGAAGTGGNGFMCGTNGGAANGSGGGGANGNGNINATSAYGLSGAGAAGGGLSAADAVSNGGTGGPSQYQGIGGGSSGTLGAAGGNGTASTIGSAEVLGGSGGGGGGSSKLANAGAGGNGGGYGSGGGGGGASLNGYNSGAGGNGGGGLVVVITR